MKSIYYYGYHVSRALCLYHFPQIQQVFLARERRDERCEEIQQLAQKQTINIEWVARERLDKLALTPHHQGIVIQSLPILPKPEQDLITQLDILTTVPLLLMLDTIQDPQNLGACLRTALACGVDAVILPKDKSATLTPLVAKISSGAMMQLPIYQVTNLARSIKTLQDKGIWVRGLAKTDRSECLYQTDLTLPLALVLGAEGGGLRRLTQDSCDGLLFIPMYGEIDSFNVSVACGIGLSEVRRQRSLVD
ncbi:MAG: 23S rRNA (guanosine(2251)-2'-O)-methyltransferase RlmB [Legionellales bacterium]|nr:23S rRNA (guanosine(2251)-2'-O)-methyltransferase RlmB [Legionellales bacterium]